MRQKLARMRGETEPRESAPRRPRELPVWQQKLLNARSRRLARDPEDRAAEFETTEGAPSDLVERTNERGRYFERVVHFSTDHRHGDWTLGEVTFAEPPTFALLARDPDLKDLDPERVVYLDTETTGLSGGAGTYVFQVGLGSFGEAGFTLWQGFLSEPSDEAAMLAETARRITESSGVVSFFGKSFDRHRLEDKMRLHGIRAPFEERPHLDLYHPLWRLYKGVFPDGRLRTMESRLCGLVRPDDLPGSQAPAAWFDFLADRPHRLEGVFRHNADDVLSLATLTAYLGRVVDGKRADGSELAGSEFARAAALARAHFEAKEDGPSIRWAERALAVDSGRSSDSRSLRLLLARSYKRTGNHASALAECESVLSGDEDRHTVFAAIEAAKLLEHQLKDRGRALERCEFGLGACERAMFGSEYSRAQADLTARMERLRRSL